MAQNTLIKSKGDGPNISGILANKWTDRRPKPSYPAKQRS